MSNANTTSVDANSESSAASIRVMVLFSSGDVGGAEKSLTRMALASADTTICYTLATVGATGDWSRWLRSLGVSATSYGIFPARPSSARALFKFMGDCRRLRPHIIYAIGIRAAAVARLMKIVSPSMKVVHGIRSTFPKGSKLARSFRLSEGLLKSLTDFYIANTRRGALDLVRMVRIPAQKLQVIHNGVELAPLADPAEQRACTIAVVANINGYKGHERFLDVVDLVRTRVPDLVVLFVGRNDLGDTMISAIERRGLNSTVRVLGFHTKPEDIVRGVRVLALPSPQIEGCPTAVLEAMAMGVPVVAYAVGGLLEIIADCQNGVLVAPGDLNAFASALKDLLLDTGLNDQMGKRARQTIDAHFTLKSCAREHAGVWRTVLGEHAIRG